MSKIFAVIIAAAVIGMFGVSDVKAEHDQLTGDQIKQLVSGATATNDYDGREVVSHLGGDGSIQLDILEIGFSDTGKWTIEGDRYCSQFTKVRYGKKACFIFKHITGDKYIMINTSDNQKTPTTFSK